MAIGVRQKMPKGKLKQRNFGIDLLKIASMLLVVILHVMGKGGVLGAVEPGTYRYVVSWLIEIGAYCAVNCFALASGYTGFRSSRRPSNLLLLWLRVLFYSVGITVCFAVLSPDSVTPGQWRAAVLPTMFQQYWYFTAYFCLFFFMPLLNIAIDRLSRVELLATAVGIVFVLSVLPTVSGTDIFGAFEGYSAIWLMALYVIGGYFGKYRVLPGMTPLRCLVAYAISVSVTLLALILLQGKDASTLAGGDASMALINYTSPTILVCGISLLMFFERIAVESSRLKKVISFLVPLSFSVYLIHTHPLVFDRIIGGAFAWIADQGALLIVPLVLASAFGIYLVCTAIDFVVSKLFAMLKVNALARRIDLIGRRSES